MLETNYIIPPQSSSEPFCSEDLNRILSPEARERSSLLEAYLRGAISLSTFRGLLAEELSETWMVIRSRGGRGPYPWVYGICRAYPTLGLSGTASQEPSEEHDSLPQGTPTKGAS